MGKWDEGLTLSWPSLPVALGQRCNFGCPYCWTTAWAARQIAELERTGALWSVADVEEASASVYHRYGAIRWLIGGPEPTQCLEALAALGRHHDLAVCTNLSFDPATVADRIGHRAEFAVSYHPTEWRSLEEFTARYLACHELGLRVEEVSIVAWPPFLPELADWVKGLQAAGITVALHQFQGQHKGLRYPGAYTDEQRRLIGATGVGASRPTHWQGRCRAGQVFAMVAANGDVFRCPNDPEVLGNVKAEINWHTEPQPCRAASCTCYALRGLRCPE